MELTFVTSHKFVMEDASLTQQIIEKLPALKMPDIVSTCVHVCMYVCKVRVTKKLTLEFDETVVLRKEVAYHSIVS